MAKSVHAALAVAAGAMLLVATAASAQIAPNPLFPYPGQCKSGQTGSACATIPNPPLLTPLPFVGQPMFAYELAQPVGFFPASVAGQDYYEIAYAPAKGFQKLAELGIFPNPSWPGGVPNGYQWTGIVDPATRAPLLTPVWGYEQKNSGGGPLALLAGMPVSSWPSMNIAASRGTDVKVKWLNETPDQHLTCPYPQAWDWPCAIDRSVDDLARRMGFMGTQWASKSGIIPPGASKVCAKGAGELNQPQSGLACAGNADCPAGETCTAEAVTPFGGAMQADNAVVPHLHGGNIPPGSDGFAEKWFGNVVTAPKYSPGVPWPGANHPCDATCAVKAGFTGSYCIGDAAACTAVDENGDVIGWPLDPGFDVGNNITPLYRPIGNSATYHYPMSQEAATIWYHDHALGKTRINVIAGPAGFFPITDPAGSADAMLASYGLSDPTGLATCYTVNPGPPVTATFNGKSCRDRFIALQDRAFNDDGTINYPNGLGQPPIPPIQPGNINNDAGGAVTPGFNPSVIPQWVPEYFGDMSVVNGVIWPKVTVYSSVYRLRLLGGANSRCYLLGLQAGAVALPFNVIATEQGYLNTAKATPALTICPGERYEALVDFRAVPAGTRVVMTNAGGAPFPNGVTPQQNRSPFAAMAQIMAFDVTGADPADPTAGLPAKLNKMVIDPTFEAKSYTRVNPAGNGTGALKLQPGNCLISPRGTCDPLAPPQLHYLNEVLNPATGAPEKVRIDGKSFEDALLQTQPNNGFQVWEIVNTTVDAHPMHLHLVKLQIMSRQALDTRKYLKAVTAPGAAMPTLAPVSATPFLMGAPRPPAPEEMGFKDTAVSYPGEVLKIVAWWGGEYPQAAPGVRPDNVASFAPVTNGPYVWHCHIVDHEDREMMRPTLVQ